MIDPPVPHVHQSRFRAMGSDAHLVVVADDTALLVGAIARVGQLERRWSRFLARSEVSVLNRRAGRATRVSDDTRLLVARAIAAWRLTGGTFDPTVLGDVIRAGYDRSFDEIDAVARAGTSPLHRGASRITLTGDTVNLPVGVGFDPGGIGKGLAADLIASEALAGGAAGVCVNLGGDLRVCGRGPDGAAAWPIAVTYPGLADPIVTLVLGDGAVATSTTVRRRWTVRGRRRHHLIDPLTGEPSDSDLSLVTVVSGEAWTSEVLAKAELLRGSARLFDLVGGTGGEALAVTTTGDVLVTAGFRRFVVGPIPQRVALDLAVAS